MEMGCVSCVFLHPGGAVAFVACCQGQKHDVSSLHSFSPLTEYKQVEIDLRCPDGLGRGAVGKGWLVQGREGPWLNLNQKMGRQIHLRFVVVVSPLLPSLTLLAAPSLLVVAAVAVVEGVPAQVAKIPIRTNRRWKSCAKKLLPFLSRH